jgi:hypothetical protein
VPPVVPPNAVNMMMVELDSVQLAFNVDSAHLHPATWSTKSQILSFSSGDCGNPLLLYKSRQSHCRLT